ncbi:hypothetical protein [Sphingosinicella sp. BN140058]|uniref:hypothetical protein n=1 Tax=Sphingosinicella sp. BN140058 TaxID=1892855 RepID=UPI0013EE301C|nr:hypothetical protein [Sphingosinicella sp. BN140058]
MDANFSSADNAATEVWPADLPNQSATAEQSSSIGQAEDPLVVLDEVRRTNGALRASLAEKTSEASQMQQRLADALEEVELVRTVLQVAAMRRAGVNSEGTLTEQLIRHITTPVLERSSEDDLPPRPAPQRFARLGFDTGVVGLVDDIEMGAVGRSRIERR